MKNLLRSILFILLALISIDSYAQHISFSGQLGYAQPKGDAFTDATGQRLSSFGISYEADILFHPFMFDEKLGFGVTYVGSALFGKNSSQVLDIGIYGLSLIGVKGQYRLLSPDKTFSPYGSLGLGVSIFETPEMTSGGSVIIPSDKSYSFGVRPEIGLEINGVIISASYFVPMKYDVQSTLGTFKGTAGSLTIAIGYRHSIDL